MQRPRVAYNAADSFIRGMTSETMKKQAVITEDELPTDVIRAIEQGKKIEAIKLLREATGLGLANAKVLVDKAARQHGPKGTMPGFVTEESNVGKLLKMLLLVAVAYLAYRHFLSA